MVRIATATKMSKAPVMLRKLYGSPKTMIPTTIAVSGSKAPSIATMVLSISFSDIVTQILLNAVGMSPSIIRFRKHRPLEMVSIHPFLPKSKAASINIPMKKT